MSYIEKNLLPDEKVLFRTTKHPIIFLTPGILLILALLLCTGNQITSTIHNVINQIFLLSPYVAYIQRIPLLIMAIVIFSSGFKQWLIYVTSEYAVTTKRVIMKEGFFDRYVCDTRLVTISHVTVDQNLLAQALNYGTITINGFGGASDSFTQIASPNEFQKAVHANLDKTMR